MSAENTSSNAFLYHSIEKCGTDKGLKEKLPEIEMCGSFRLGSDQEKLKMLLIRSIAVCTAFFAPFTALEIDVWMPLNMLDTVFFAELKPLLMDVPIPLTVLLTEVLMLFQTVDAVV